MSGPVGKLSCILGMILTISGPLNFLLCRVTELRFCFLPVPDFFEDTLPLPAQAYLKVCSAVSEASLNDVKPSSPPTIMDSPGKEAVSPSTGTTVQRTSVLHTQEIVRVQCYYIKTFLSSYVIDQVKIYGRFIIFLFILLIIPILFISINYRYVLLSFKTSSSLSDKVAGQSDVNQAGDHHRDTEHPSGGQEREGEEVPHYLWGDETCGSPQAGGHTEHLSSGETRRSQRQTESRCETGELVVF